MNWLLFVLGIWNSRGLEYRFHWVHELYDRNYVTLTGGLHSEYEQGLWRTNNYCTGCKYFFRGTIQYVLL